MVFILKSILYIGQLIKRVSCTPALHNSSFLPYIERLFYEFYKRVKIPFLVIKYCPVATLKDSPDPVCTVVSNVAII